MPSVKGALVIITKNMKLGIWWHTPVIPTLMRIRWEDGEFQANLGYIVRPHLKTKQP
jgi:hypothetical protein